MNILLLISSSNCVLKLYKKSGKKRLYAFTRLAFIPVVSVVASRQFRAQSNAGLSRKNCILQSSLDNRYSMQNTMENFRRARYLLEILALLLILRNMIRCSLIFQGKMSKLETPSLELDRFENKSKNYQMAIKEYAFNTLYQKH